MVKKQLASPVIASHGVSQATHESYYAQYSKAGYRIVTHGVSGDLLRPQYSAVWKQREGLPFQALSTPTTSALRTFIEKWRAQGYILTQIAVTGFLTSPWFSVIIEQSNITDWSYELDMQPGAFNGSFDYFNAQARLKLQILRSFGIYGVDTAIRYLAVWHHDPTFTKWHSLTWSNIFQYRLAQYDEESIPFFRPSMNALNIDYQHAAIWSDESVGNFSEYPNLTSTEYQSVYDQLRPQGMYPINLRAGDSGVDTRYTAIFAPDDVSQRIFIQASGRPPVVGIDEVDTIVRSFMTKNGVRSAQFSVYQNGAAKHQAVYSYTEPSDTSTVRVEFQLRLAGLSEIFVAAVVQYCYDNDLLTPATSAYPFVDFGATVPKDLRSNSITIQQLLDHEGGYTWTSTGDPNTSTDPTYHMLEVAQALNHTSSSPRLTKCNLTTYMYTQISLGSDPGAKYHDPSFGYVLLTLCVEYATGLEFLDFLTTKITGPAGLNITHFPTDAPSAANP
ncbi:MAG: hypothetical protein Q9213_003776 [Squamulea squamosa]